MHVPDFDSEAMTLYFAIQQFDIIESKTMRKQRAEQIQRRFLDSSSDRACRTALSDAKMLTAIDEALPGAPRNLFTSLRLLIAGYLGACFNTFLNSPQFAELRRQLALPEDVLKELQASGVVLSVGTGTGVSNHYHSSGATNSGCKSKESDAKNLQISSS